jgi:hypothetical protein
MLSILVPSRVKNNPDSDLNLMLTSLMKSLDPQYHSLIEIIFKFDSDDTLVPPKSFFDRFPFVIKTCTFSPCDRRASLDIFLNYIFTLRNPDFKFVINANDDIVYTRKNWIEDYFNLPKYAIVDSAFESLRKHNYDTWEIEKLFTGEISPNIYRPIRSMVGGYLPSSTSNIIEICGNYGYQASIDVWATLLPGFLYKLYGVNLFHKIEPFFDSPGRNVPAIKKPMIAAQIRNDPFGGNGFNLMEDSGRRPCLNTYYYDLVAQQAKNIYLNIKADNELDLYKVN